MTKTLTLAAALLVPLLASAAPAAAQDRFDPRAGDPRGAEYRGDVDRRGDERGVDDRGPGDRLFGDGVRLLYPELRGTPRGRAFVMRRFDWNRDGRVSPREADAANHAFARDGGPRSGAVDTVVVVDHAPPARAPWDRGAMHGYGFRQTNRGAALTLSGDVLFATDSAVLRPGAVDRLRPLADYLRDEAGVRVAIDGFTDARGSDAHNQDLSERRAASVRDAFDRMGVTRARFQVAGHGEAAPVATNATAAGQRQNRRVEVTLLGRRAAEFADR